MSYLCLDVMSYLDPWQPVRLQCPVPALSKFRLNSSGLIGLYLSEKKVTLLLPVEAVLERIYLSWTQAFSFQVMLMLIHGFKKKGG